MCLYTHQEKPKIAEHNIHVFKVLEGNKTPYRKKRVYFLFGRAFMRSRLKFEQHNVDLCASYIIHVGIHAFSSQLDARMLALFADGLWHCNIYHAIIPKGSKYAIGFYNEIASNKLIIFKTEKDYNAYLAKHKQEIINL